MGKIIKSSVFDIEISDKSLFLAGKSLEDILKELSSKLDDTDSNNTRIIDTNVNDVVKIRINRNIVECKYVL